MLRLIEPAHKIMVLITQAISDGSGEPRCLHTCSVEVDEGSTKNQTYARLKNEFTEAEKYHNLMRWRNLW